MTKSEQALMLLASDPRRDIYETCNSDRGQPPCGEFMLSYSNGQGPVLTRLEVEDLLQKGRIRLRWPDDPKAKCYILAPTADGDRNG